MKNVISTFFSSGSYTATWDQMDAAGSPAPDGDYFFKFTSPDGPIDSESIVLASTTSAVAGFSGSATDADHNVYRLDAVQAQITKTSPEGFLLAQLPIGSLPAPSGLALNSGGDLLVQTSSGTALFSVGRVDFSAKTLSANIRIPWDNALVRATVPIIGGASGRNFASYTVEVGPTWIPSSFTVLNKGYSQVIDNFVFPSGPSTVYGNLATWETGLVGGEEYPAQDLFHPPQDTGLRGRWTIRLRANDTLNREAVSQRKVIIGRVLNNATGGVIVSEDAKARIRVPPLALQEDWSLFGLVIATTTSPAYQPARPRGLAPISPMYELMPAGYTFKQPVSFEVAVTTVSHLNQIGLYVYDTNSGGWNRLPVQPSILVDTATGLTSALFTYPSLTTIPNFDGFYALYADTSTPPSPVLNPLPAATTRRDLLISGFADPLSTVNLYFTSGSESSFTIRAAYPVNAQGVFTGQVIFTSTGTYGIAAAEVNLSGNLSALSVAQNVQVLNAVPSVITSLRFADVNFSTTPLTSLQRNAPVFIEMQASDIDSAQTDAVYVVLSGSVSDPTGILVPLIQIDPTSSVYRGSAYLGNSTDASFLMLSAKQVGESVTAVPQGNTAVRASLPLGDATLPAAPLIFSPTHPASFQDTFEKDLSQWATFNSGSGAAVTLDTTTASTGQNSVQLRQTTEGGDFSALISNRPFDARRLPVVSFDYLFPASAPAPRFSFYFRRNGVLHQVEATETGVSPKNLPPAFVRIGSIMNRLSPGDHQWHHMEFDLLAMFKSLYPADTTYAVDQIFLADFNQTQFFGMVPGNNPVGDTVHFDNFMVRSAGASSASPFFTWTPPAGHITGYSYALDQSSFTIPPAASLGTGTAVSFSGLAPGLWYFHARAENAQGVWGPANHYVFRVDADAPLLSDPSPMPALPLLRTPQTTVSVALTDASGIDLDSLVFSVNGSSYRYASGGVSFDAAAGRLTIALTALRPAPLVHDGDIVTVTVNDLADLAGNHIGQPFSWSWQADFSASIGGGFGPVTFNGGKDAAWSRDSQRLAFSSNRFGNDDLFVVSSQGANALFESSATLKRLTSTGANENQPSWSPDGARLAYVSDTGGHKNIWMTRYDGSGAPIQLTSASEDDSHPSWNTDGTQIYFSRATSGLGTLWAVDMDTHTWLKAGEHQVSKDDIGFDLEPAISPDGGSLLYHRSLYVDNLYRVGINGVGPVALTNTGADITPAWSPNGDQMVFATKRVSPAYQLWVMDSSGVSPHLLLDNANTWPDTQPAWSPDGGRIAFTTTRSGAPNIWVLSVLQVSSFTASPASFSPGGLSASAKHFVTFSYQLSASNATAVLDVLDDHGATVAHLIQAQVQIGGSHSATWDGRGANNAVIPDGAYYARLTVTGPAALDPIVRQAPFIINSAGPAVSLEATSGNPVTGFFNPGTVFTLKASGRSPIQEIDLAIDTTSQFQVYSGTFSLPAGPHLLSMRALDTAGNLSAPVLRPANIDDRAPASTVTYQGASFPRGAGSVYVSSLTAFTITAVDSASSTVVSGVARIDAIRIAAVFSSTSSLSLSAFGPNEGSQTILFAATDNAGNVEPGNTLVPFVDSTPPVVSTTAVPPLFFNGSRTYASAGTLFGFSAQDPISAGDASGVSRILISIDGNAFVPFVSTFTPVSLGSHSIRYVAIDNVGNASAVQALNVTVVTTLPTAVLNVSTPSYIAGTPLTGTTNYAAPQTRFSFSIAAGAPPADSFSVNLDHSGFQTLPVAGSFSFGSQGLHTIEFRAVRGGIAEAADAYAVVIDSTPPVTSLTFAGAQFGSYVRTDSAFTLTALDNGSGVGGVTYILDGSTFTYMGPFSLGSRHGLSAGTHTFQWSAVDFLGNSEPLHSQTVTLDNTPPAAAVQLTGGEQFNDGFLEYASSGTGFVIAAYDAGSGVQNVFVDMGTGAGYQEFVGTLTFPTQGLYALNYYAVDYLGNASPSSTFRVYIDTSAPPVSSSPTIATVQAGTFTYARAATGFAITTGVDNLSGLASLTVLADGAPSGSPARFLTEGPHTLEAYATDHVGNQTSPHLQVSLVIDETPPVSTLVVSSNGLSISATDYYSGSQTPGAGVKISYIALDGGSDQIVEGNFAVANGTHTVSFFSIDLLGNQETRHSEQVVIGGARVPSEHGFVRHVSPGTPQSSVTGWVGYKFIMGPLPLALTSLGRLCTSGNSGTHQVKVVDAEGFDVPGASVAVAMAGCVPDQFIYAVLAAPIALAANHAYYLVSSEMAGGDLWRGGDTWLETSKEAMVSQPVTGGVNGGYEADWRGAGYGFGPVDFRYTRASSVPLVPAPPADAFVQGKNLGVLRNDLSGWAGYKFTVSTSSLLITNLGRLYAAGNTETHTVKVVDILGFDVPGAIATVTMIGGVPGQFRYTALTAPVTLQANHEYYLVSSEISGGDAWYGEGTWLQAAGIAILNQPVIHYLTGTYEPDWRGTGYGFGPVDFRYAAAPSQTFAGLPGAVEASDSSFAWGSVFVFPNPARGGAVPTLHAEVGVADRVTFRIFNTAGQELHEAVIDTPPTLIDSGNGPQLAYEYPWTGRIASGVYLFVVDAEKGGQHSSKRGKFAVVR